MLRNAACKLMRPALLPAPTVQHVSVVGFRKKAQSTSWLPPKKYENVEIPERQKLMVLPKVPQYPPNIKPPRMKKAQADMRGPELIHNKLLYKQFGVQALCGGNLRHGHIEVIRLTIGRKIDTSRMFAKWRIDPPWKAVSKKGQGHRMGGGKSPIDHYVFPVKSGRIIFELAGKMEWEEVQRFMSDIAMKMPFKARAVSQEMLDEEAEEEKYIMENNINPYTMEYMIKNNINGIKTYCSKYDYMWYGKYR